MVLDCSESPEDLLALVLDNGNGLIFEVDSFSVHGVDKGVDLKKWCYEHKGYEGVAERGRAWSQYLNHQSYIFNLRHPYATTVHKSQGSEFPNVVVIEERMAGSNLQEHNRWKYTAITRASRKCALIGRGTK